MEIFNPNQKYTAIIVSEPLSMDIIHTRHNEFNQVLPGFYLCKEPQYVLSVSHSFDECMLYLNRIIDPNMIGLHCERILIMTDEFGVDTWRENVNHLIPPHIQLLYFGSEQLVNTNLDREGALYQFLTLCMTDPEDRDVIQIEENLAQQGELSEEEDEQESDEDFTDINRDFELYLVEKRNVEPVFSFQPPSM